VVARSVSWRVPKAAIAAITIGQLGCFGRGLCRLLAAHTIVAVIWT